MTQDALMVFGCAFFVSAFAGLAALLRSTTALTWKSAATAISNSGVLGLGISLLWYAKFQDNIYALIGVCVIAGLGGMTTIDFVLNSIRKGGFSVKLGQNGDMDVSGVKLENEKKEGQ